MNLSISVIIPSLGSEKNLLQLLNSIRNQEFDFSLLEVIIVLNGVDEARTVQIQQAIQQDVFRCQVVRIEQKGANRARNRGIELANNQILLFLDDDCTLSNRKFLSQHSGAHQKRPLIFGFGGGYELPAQSGFFDQVYNYLQMRWLTLGSISGSAKFLLGGNFSVKALELREKNLFFDNSIVYGGSEYEFFVKAGRQGMLLESDLYSVLHHTSESLQSLTRKNFLQGRGAALIDQKYPRLNSVGGKSVTDANQSVLTNLFLLYFNYVFWAGYYSLQNRSYLVIGRMFGDFVRALNYYRYEVLKKISGLISEKNRNS